MTTLKSFEKGQKVWVILANEMVAAFTHQGIADIGAYHNINSADGRLCGRACGDADIFGSHSEALQELAKRQLRAYAETLRELATVDPEATFSVLIGDAYLVNPTADVLAVAIRKTFGETQGEDS